MKSSGLPKKMCERIVVERNGDWARALIESKGRRIFSVEVEMGAYNDPLMEVMRKDYGPGYRERGACLLFQYEYGQAPEGQTDVPEDAPGQLRQRHRLPDLGAGRASHRSRWSHRSTTRGRRLAVVKPLGAGYSVNSNWVAGVSPLAEFEGDEADSLISYLFSGRWDRSTLVTGRFQRYGQF